MLPAVENFVYIVLRVVECPMLSFENHDRPNLQLACRVSNIVYKRLRLVVEVALVGGNTRPRKRFSILSV